MQGGVGDYSHAIARGLAARGVQVGVLTSLKAAGQTQPEAEGSAYSVLPIVSGWGWSSLRLVARHAREFSADVVHIQYQTGAYAMHPAINLLPQFVRRLTPSPALRAPPPPLLNERRSGEGEGGRGVGVRTATTFHDLLVPYLFPKAGPVRGWVTRQLARTSDAVIATNEQDHAQLAAWNIQASLIPIGSNIPTAPPAGYHRSAWRAQLGIAPDEILLCHFGFVNARKGCDTLIRALAELPNVRLLMIGGQTGASDPTNAASLEQVRVLIAEQGLSDRVLWTGFTAPDAVTGNFLASDLCVLPYRQGASYQHGTLMAALAHGMPIITTRPRPLVDSSAGLPVRHASLPPLCDGENCLLVSPDDPHALAQAIARAAASPDLRAKMSAGARALAQHFTWDRIVEQHVELYRRLLAA